MSPNARQARDRMIRQTAVTVTAVVLAGLSFLITWQLGGQPDPTHGASLIGLVLLGLVVALAAVHLGTVLLHYLVSRRRMAAASTGSAPRNPSRSWFRIALGALGATIIAFGVSAPLSGTAFKIASWVALGLFAGAVLALTLALLANMRSLLSR